MEIGEAPPAADEASRFRGSGTIGAPDRRGNRNAATVTSEFTILIFSVPAGTEFCEAAVKWKSVADFYPQGVRGIRKAAKLPTAAQDCRARRQIMLNFFGATESELPQSSKRSRPGACACQKTLLAQRVSSRRRGTERSENASKGRPWPDFCVVHKLFTLPPIDNGKCRWYTAFSTQGEGVLKLRKGRGVWT